MTEPKKERAFGLDDRELAELPTVYAPGAFAGKTVLISGGAGGIGRAAGWLLGRLGAASFWRDVTRASSPARSQRCRPAASRLRPLRRHPQARGGPCFDGDGRRRDRRLRHSDQFGRRPVPAGGDRFFRSRAGIPSSHQSRRNLVHDAAAARLWRDAGRPGSIVNIVVVVEQGLYGVAHTIAARSGVIGLSRNLAVEWRRSAFASIASRPA